MKKLLFTLMILLCIIQTSFCDDFFVSLNLTWEMSIRIGIEYRICRYIGIKTDAGFAIYGLISADAAVVIYFLPQSQPWQLNFLMGIPNVSVAMDISTPASMISIGASLLLGYSFSKRYIVYLRIGEGFPLFFEKDKEMIRDIKFPFGLWPDIVVGMNYLL